MALISLLLISALWPFIVHSYRVGIVNGSEATPHTRPYMVSVQRDGVHICGGFLVSEHFVMTAARCWKYADNLTVLLGAHDLTMIHCCSTRMDVKYYHIHPAYHDVDNDIMLLQLNGSAKLTPAINWINIVKENKEVRPNSICSVAGWGSTAAKVLSSFRLMEVDVKILDSKQCERSWGNKFSASRIMCTTGRGGFCKRDAGGPLVCNNTAVGIASFYDEASCKRPRAPNVYTKISEFLSWITPIIDSMK